MEDIGNILVLAFFLLVGVISSLAKAISDWSARKSEMEKARKAAEKLRAAQGEGSDGQPVPEAVYGPLGGLGVPPDAGRPAGRAETEGDEPEFMDEYEARPAPPAAMAVPRIARDEGRALDQKPPTTADYRPAEAGAPLVQSPAMSVHRSSGAGSGAVFRVRRLGRHSLREAFVLSEVLAPPLSLRNQGQAPGC